MTDPVDELTRVIEETLRANALRLTTVRGGYVGGGQPHAELDSDPGAADAIARGLLARRVAEPSRVLAPVGDGLREAAHKTADWLDMTQAIYHGTVQGWPGETRDTCDAGMCGDYREHRDRLRAALAATEDPDRAG